MQGHPGDQRDKGQKTTGKWEGRKPSSHSISFIGSAGNLLTSCLLNAETLPYRFRHTKGCETRTLKELIHEAPLTQLLKLYY